MSDTKFKVGDRVKFVSSCHAGAKIGDEVTIVGTNVHDEAGIGWEYHLSDGRYCDGRDNSLELIPRDLDHLRVGDTLLDDCERSYTVVMVVGQVVGLADRDGDYDSTCTVSELKSGDWTLVDAEPEIKELTMDEVAELAGVSVDKLRIKKED